MFTVKYFILFIFLFSYCNALNCRSDGGPKEEELKNIYMTCLKRQDGRNSSGRRSSSSDDWNQSRGYNQRSQWDSSEKDRSGYRDDRTGNRDDRYNSRDTRMGSDRNNKNDQNGNDGRMSSSNRYDRTGSTMNPRNDMMGSDYGRREDVNGRDDFAQSDDFGSETSYNYRSSTQSPRRYKRDTHAKMNSGQRSQYNPNIPSSKSSFDSYRNDNRNSSGNNSKREMEKRACALHCFLENLEMTGDDDMPDRYLVTHALTKNVKNEDLRDFLQESVEECFQILDNENPEDKCEFSKNLLMCLSEKGKANCDDWKDEIQF